MAGERHVLSYDDDAGKEIGWDGAVVGSAVIDIAGNMPLNTKSICKNNTKIL